jgi:hypothetical protein
MTTALAQTLYTAHSTVTGGRAGHGRTSDGELEVDLRPPAEMGGDGGSRRRQKMPIQSRTTLSYEVFVSEGPTRSGDERMPDGSPLGAIHDVRARAP